MSEDTRSQEAPSSVHREEEGSEFRWGEIFSNHWVKVAIKAVIALGIGIGLVVFVTKASTKLLIIGGAFLAISGIIWWYRRTPSFIRHGGKTLGSVLTGQAKLIMWLVFHVAFWSAVARIVSWEYVGEWWWGRYSLFLYPMHLIYVSRGVLPNNIDGQLHFGNRLTQVMLGVLFGFMLMEVGFYTTGKGSLFSRIPGYADAGSAKYSIPGPLDGEAYSDELSPGAFSVWMIPEGKDSSGVLKKMEVGTLPTGTKWVQIFKVNGRVYTDKLIYRFEEGKLAVEDDILVNDYGLPSPDSDGDGLLTVSQSPLWLVVGDSIAGWRLVHPDKFELATALAEPTKLYVLFNSEQAKSGNGVINLEIRSGV
ncbi:hypothetical protein KJ810_01845 [Patescibacteria group bacterium]|nr:hypothetical protein [Patescibacteria group bacterium]